MLFISCHEISSVHLKYLLPLRLKRKLSLITSLSLLLAFELKQLYSLKTMLIGRFDFLALYYFCSFQISLLKKIKIKLPSLWQRLALQKLSLIQRHIHMITVLVCFFNVLDDRTTQRGTCVYSVNPKSSKPFHKFWM